jgi:hypothetical protein
MDHKLLHILRLKIFVYILVFIHWQNLLQFNFSSNVFKQSNHNGHLDATADLQIYFEFTALRLENVSKPLIFMQLLKGS